MGAEAASCIGSRAYLHEPNIEGMASDKRGELHLAILAVNQHLAALVARCRRAFINRKLWGWACVRATGAARGDTNTATVRCCNTTTYSDGERVAMEDKAVSVPVLEFRHTIKEVQ